MHVKSCHKKNVIVKAIEPKKRKSTDDVPTSRKKTNVVSKKVIRVKCQFVMTLKIDNYPKGKPKFDNYPKGKPKFDNYPKGKTKN